MKTLFAVLFCCLTATAGDYLVPPGKKIIDLSWSNPTVDFLQKNLAEMEKNSPLDGIVIRVWGKPQKVDGKNFIPGRAIWGKIPVQYESLREAAKTLRELPFRKFTDNFFYYTVSPGDADWFSNSDWNTVAGNAAVAAKVSKEAGLKGFLLDIEEYGKKFWNYNNLKTDRSYDEACTMAFQRGQEWGRAVFKEFPDIVIFMPFMLTYRRGGGLIDALLNVPFVNGVIDVMPPTAKLVEGYENFGYMAKKPADYVEMNRQFDLMVSRRVMTKNREKFHRQAQLAPAFYMDAIFFPKSPRWRWHKGLKPEIDGGALPFFRRNFAAALAEPGEYIWLYGERGCWWKNSPHKQVKQTWEEIAPGVTSVMTELKNPAKMDSSVGNLVKNGNFSHGLSSWNLWQLEQDLKRPVPGTGTIAKGRCVMTKLTNGCFTQRIPVKPGEHYYFRVKGGYGANASGLALATVAFLDRNGKWHNGMRNLSLRIPKTGKEEAVGIFFTVPEDAYYASIQLGASSQGKNGEAYFSDAFLRRL